MSEFRLTIRLGNEAMSTKHDVSSALDDVARVLFPSWDTHYDTFAPGESGRIMDKNGNKVGSWKMSGS